MLGYLQAKPDQDISEQFNGVHCEGRLQRIDSKSPAQLWVDVGHNEDAARALADFFSRQHQMNRIVVLLGMLADKNVEQFVSCLKPVVDEWWLLGLDCERGLSASQLAQRVSGQIRVSQHFDNINQALKHAVLSLNNQDILLVTGSFMTVEAVLSSSV